MHQPQIIGFGAQKSGTSWLFDNIVQNPGVWRPALKEMHYFNYIETGSNWMFKGHKEKLLAEKKRSEAKGWMHRAAYFDRLLRIQMLSEEWYREAYLSCPPDKQSLDITPAYALLSKDTLNYMGKVLGESFKAIYLIRDPADRAISSIKKDMTPDVATDLDSCISKIRNKGVLSRSDYKSTIGRLDDFFGNRILYLPFMMVITNPLELLRRVEEHCGLPSGSYVQAKKPRHVSQKIEFPSGFYDEVKTILVDQYDWLERRFPGGLFGCSLTWTIDS